MILACADTWIAYLTGSAGSDVEALDDALRMGSTAMIPHVLAELVSDPKLPGHVEELLIRIPEVETLEGYWWRVGKLRALMLDLGCRPKLTGTMVAQYCFDHGAMLASRSRGFDDFVRHAGLMVF